LEVNAKEKNMNTSKEQKMGLLVQPMRLMRWFTSK
jgi:hypothetical protein